MRQWHARNPDKIAEYNRRWRATHLQKSLENNRQWKAANPDKVIEYNRRWYANNPERARETERKWRAANPVKAAAIQNKHRTLKAGSGGSYTDAEWTALCEKFGNQCIGPGPHGGNLEADHVIPVKLGGHSNISNIQPLCKSCNCRKGAKTIDYR